MKFSSIATYLIYMVLSSYLVGQSESVRSVDLLSSIDRKQRVDAEPPSLLTPGGAAPLSSRTSQIDTVIEAASDGEPAATEAVQLTLEMIQEPRVTSPTLDANTEQQSLSSDRLLFQSLLDSLELMIVTATVYDHSRTFLHVFPNGNPGAAVTAWSNLDFNHFIGFTKYLSTDADGTVRAHSFLLSVTNVNTAEQRRLFSENNQEYTPPEIPSLPAPELSGPSFEVLDGDPAGRATEVVQEIHDLYRKDGGRMAEAFIGRQLDDAAAAEEELARQQTPRQVTIRFWKRFSSVPSRP